MKRVRTAACNKRLKSKQWHFQLDKATEANWEDYKANLEKLLKKKIERKKGLIGSQKIKLQNKDELWDLIATSIIKCTKISLPGKKITPGSINTKQYKESNKTKKNLQRIRSFCQQCAKELGQKINSKNKHDLNLLLQDLSSTYEVEIEEVNEEVWSKERHDNLKTWWKIIYAKLQQERKKENLEEINSAINNRCEAIQGELKHMLSSLLERSSK